MQNFIKNFVRDSSGAWTCIKAATINGPNGRIQVTEGARFTPGTMFMGVELSKLLDEQYEKDQKRL